MKSLLICPSERPGVPALARRRPLVLAPFLGKTVLEHTLTHLASHGAKEVTVLAADRPDEIRAAVGNGEAWGLRMEVVPESRESTVTAAREKYQVEARDWLRAPFDVFVLDRLPWLPGHLLWTNYSGWLSAQQALLTTLAKKRVGTSEMASGVFLGLRSRVAASAKLITPCWIGANVSIGLRATVGPGAIVEDGCYIDEGAEVAQSVVGPRTYVGALTEVRNSFAWGKDLLELASGSCTEVADGFLLSELGAPKAIPPGRLAGRVMAFLLFLVTSPIVLVAALCSRGCGQPLFMRRHAARVGQAAPMAGSSICYRELSDFSGLARRWPQLWNVVRGEFAWVGNRPISPEQAAKLSDGFEGLWLAAPTGLISLADAMGCPDECNEETRTHASFYAVDPSRHKNAKILWRYFRGTPRSAVAPRIKYQVETKS